MSRLDFILESRTSIPTGQLVATLRNRVISKILTKKLWQKEIVGGQWIDTLTYQKWIEIKLHDWKIEARTNRVSITIPKDYLSEYLSLNIDDYYITSDDGGEIAKMLDDIIASFGWICISVNGNTFILEAEAGNRLDMPKYLYHFSLLNNKDRILRKGLFPGSRRDTSSFRFHDKVFVLLNYDIDDIKTLASSMHSENQSPEDMYYNGPILYPIVVFKIDTSKLLPGTKIYADADGTYNNMKAAWTPTRIPPNALSVIYEDTDVDEPSH